jgi:hypothetical protein
MSLNCDIGRERVKYLSIYPFIHSFSRATSTQRTRRRGKSPTATSHPPRTLSAKAAWDIDRPGFEPRTLSHTPCLTAIRTQAWSQGIHQRRHFIFFLSSFFFFFFLNQTFFLSCFFFFFCSMHVVASDNFPCWLMGMAIRVTLEFCFWSETDVLGWVHKTPFRTWGQSEFVKTKSHYSSAGNLTIFEMRTF